MLIVFKLILDKYNNILDNNEVVEGLSIASNTWVQFSNSPF